MNVEIDAVGAARGFDCPCRFPSGPETPIELTGHTRRTCGIRPSPNRQRQIKADKAVERPDDGNDAEQTHAPAIAAPELGDVKRVVQLVEKETKFSRVTGQTAPQWRRPSSSPVAGSRNTWL